MSDQETAPWIRKAAETIQRKYNPFSGGIQQLIEIIEKLLAGECTAPAPQPAATLEHSRSCPEGSPLSEERCTCGLDWRIALQTEQTMHAAWRKRAEEAELELARVLAATPQVTPTDARIQAFWNAQAEWSRATFGSDEERDHIGPLKHLAKEAVEAQVRPADRTEIADCQFLVFDAARRSGMTLAELFDVCDQKLIVNKARKWSRPTSDNPVEHVREGTSEQASPTHHIDSSTIYDDLDDMSYRQTHNK